MRKLWGSVLATVLTVCAVFSFPVSVSADGDTWEEIRQTSYETLPDTDNLEGWPAGPLVYAKAAVVMDMDSGAILYGKNMDERLYPASITKLLTALVALENGDFEDEVTFTEDSISFLEYDHANIGMKPGEIISMKDAMYALLLASANEVAYAIAENVGAKMGGSYDTFIQKMNERSTELGCTGSQWTNANGLPDEQHYTTAHDMALIASEVSKHQELLDIMETLSYTMEPTNLDPEPRTFEQHHKMLWEGNNYYYEYCIGGKTGYTDSAGTTLVTMADNGQMRLAAVVLFDYGTDAYVDTRAMFDYVYNNFSKVSISGAERAEEVRAYVTSEPYVVLPAGIEFDDLDKEIIIRDEKQAAGRLVYRYQGQEVGSAEVILTPEYIESATGYTTRLEPDYDSRKGAGQEEDSMPLRVKAVIGIGAAGSVFLCAGAATVLAVRHRKKRRRMIRRRRQRKRLKREQKYIRRPRRGRKRG